MKTRVAALLEELQRLKRAGVQAVPVSDEALARLRAALARADRADRAGGAGGAGAGADGARTGSGESGAKTDVANNHQNRSGSGSRPSSTPLHELMNQVARSSTKSRVAFDRPASGAKPDAPAITLPEPPTIVLPEGSKRERWEWLRRRVLDCPVCRAHTHGDFKVVFGVGNIDADIFFCGEAPGGEEEEQGEPFVGPAGRLLTRMINTMGLQREQVYIGNILNWRPEMEGRVSGRSIAQTGNRPPTPEEMKFCLPYLRAQVEVVQPKVIVALGSTAAAGLLGFGSFKTLGAIRGRWQSFNNTPLMVTYHPSYLLRNASNRMKRVVWEDLLQVMERVGLPISEKQRGFFL